MNFDFINPTNIGFSCFYHKNIKYNTFILVYYYYTWNIHIDSHQEKK